MSTELTAKADATGTLEAPLRPELVEATRDYMAEARAQTTRRAYGRAWAAFEAWCRAEGRQALPASPDTLAAWMTAMAAGVAGYRPLARATINQALSAIVLAHRTAGHPLDRKHPLLAETWRGIFPDEGPRGDAPASQAPRCQ